MTDGFAMVSATEAVRGASGAGEVQGNSRETHILV
jgi:hypothetical protein